MKDKIKFYLEKDVPEDMIDIHIRSFSSDQRKSRALPLSFVVISVDDIGRYNSPMLKIDYAEAQQLMDSLWDCGLRPSEGSGSAGALAATQKHLDDMRNLVTKLIGERK